MIDTKPPCGTVYRHALVIYGVEATSLKNGSFVKAPVWAAEPSWEPSSFRAAMAAVKTLSSPCLAQMTDP
jgi:hypothetical protein